MPYFCDRFSKLKRIFPILDPLLFTFLADLSKRNVALFWELLYWLSLVNQVSYWLQNSTTPWKRLQKSPNDALIAHTKDHHIRPWFYWQKTNKNMEVVDTYWTQHMEMSHAVTLHLRYLTRFWIHLWLFINTATVQIL